MDKVKHAFMLVLIGICMNASAFHFHGHKAAGTTPTHSTSSIIQDTSFCPLCGSIFNTVTTPSLTGEVFHPLQSRITTSSIARYVNEQVQLSIGRAPPARG